MPNDASIGSLYCLGFLEKMDVCFTKDEWKITNTISNELIKNIVDGRYRLVFLQEENIFSHEMNILRKAITINNTKIIIGAQVLYPILSHSKCLVIDTYSQRLKIDETVYQFKNYNYYAETSELLEFDTDDKAICYRPDYYYHREFASIVAEGYTKSIRELIGDINSYAKYKSDGRVWCVNGLFPSDLTKFFIKNPVLYFENIGTYVSILKEIYGIAVENKNSENLRGLLVNHFKYSLMFSFSLPYLTQTVIDEEGVSKMEKVYSLFVKNSPIQDKESLTKNTLYNMEALIGNVCNKSKGLTDAFQPDFIEVIDDDFTTHDLLFFVANMTSDLRRCVINLLIENNDWFKSICGHRRKHCVY